jgi:hypothetical protein
VKPYLRFSPLSIPCKYSATCNAEQSQGNEHEQGHRILGAGNKAAKQVDKQQKEVKTEYPTDYSNHILHPFKEAFSPDGSLKSERSIPVLVSLVEVFVAFRKSVEIQANCGL